MKLRLSFAALALLVASSAVACSGMLDIDLPPTLERVDAGPPITLGAYILDKSPPVSGSAPFQAQAMANYAAMVGAKPSIIMWYVKWSGPFPTADVDRIVAFGATPMITWEGCLPPAICQTQAASSAYASKN